MSQIDLMIEYTNQSQLGKAQTGRNNIQKCLQQTSRNLCSTQIPSGSKISKNISTRIPSKKKENIKTELRSIRLGPGSLFEDYEVAEVEKEILKSSQEVESLQSEIYITRGWVDRLLLQPFEATWGNLWDPFFYEADRNGLNDWMYHWEKKSLSNSEQYQSAIDDRQLFKIKNKIESGQKLNINDYSVEEAIADVMEFHDACQVKPRLLTQPNILTLKYLTSWVHRLKTCQVSPKNEQDLKRFWDTKKNDFEDVPLIKNLLDKAIKELDKYNPFNCTVASSSK